MVSFFTPKKARQSRWDSISLLTSPLSKLHINANWLLLSRRTETGEAYCTLIPSFVVPHFHFVCLSIPISISPGHNVQSSIFVLPLRCLWTFSTNRYVAILMGLYLSSTPSPATSYNASFSVKPHTLTLSVEGQRKVISERIIILFNSDWIEFCRKTSESLNQPIRQPHLGTHWISTMANICFAEFERQEKKRSEHSDRLSCCFWFAQIQVVDGWIVVKRSCESA